MNYFVVASVVFVLIFSGCQTSSVSRETKLEFILASEAGCIAPCWKSIVPGSSTEKDFLDLVDASDPDLFDDMKHTNLNPEGIEYTWDDNVNGFFSRVRIHGDRIKLLEFLWPNNELSLSLITESYGFPSAYGASVLGSHEYYVKLSLIYEEEGVVIETNIPIDTEQLGTIMTTCEI